jgi:hypothetical protein
MPTILEELYYGRLRPDEAIVPQDPAYDRINERISDAVEGCKRSLTEVQFRQLEEILDLMGESHSIHVTAVFVYGFKMGAGLMMEVSTGQGELFRQRREE